METTKELALTRRISWGSIIGGVITVLAISLLLSMLGTSLGLSMIQPQSDDISNGAGTTVLIWSVISVLISLAAGSLVAGRLAANDGLIHGFLVWATSLIVAALIGAMATSGVVSMTGSMLGSVASATGSAISGAGSMAGKGVQNLAEMAKNNFGQLGIDTNLPGNNLDQKVIDALRKSNIDTLQPDYLQQQLQGASGEAADAIKQIAMNPDNSDAIINQLMDKLKKRTDAIGQGINRDDVRNALINNAGMSPEEADRTADNIMAARDKTSQIVNQRIQQFDQNVNQVKQQYAEMKQKAKEQAEAAAKAVSRVALWSFFGLLLGAIVSVFAGMWGVNTHPEVKRVRA